jgi:hypothetical protein
MLPVRSGFGTRFCSLSFFVLNSEKKTFFFSLLPPLPVTVGYPRSQEPKLSTFWSLAVSKVAHFTLQNQTNGAAESSMKLKFRNRMLSAKPNKEHCLEKILF